jgi:HPt (histidine-containing phosphotransfer) domain-containing protein
VRDSRIVAADALEAIDQLACGLDTGKAAADDHKMAKSLP